MKKLLKMLSAAAAGFFAAAAVAITVCAEDYEFDVSDAKQSNGSWGQSFTEYTALDGDSKHADHFNPTWLTEDSEIIVEYTYEGTVSRSPVELVWQTWDGPAEKNPDVLGDWNKISPYEYDETSAKFAYEDIVAAYGTDDFGTVYAVNVGDTGVKLTVTKMTATNVNMGGESDAQETEAETKAETEAVEADASVAEETEEDAVEETEAVTEKETEAETTAKETTAKVTTAAKETSQITTAVNIADNAPDEDSAFPIIIMVVAIVVVVAVIVVIVVLMIKKTKGRYY